MGLEALAMGAMLAASLTSVGTSIASVAKKPKKPAVPTRGRAELAARQQSEEERARRGRASTLTTPGGGLSETPALGRPSLLGAA